MTDPTAPKMRPVSVESPGNDGFRYEPVPERPTPPDDTEGLREQIEAALRSTWDGAPTLMEEAIHEEAAAVMAVVSPVLERLRTALAATRSDVDAMQREVHRHVLANTEQQGEVERLRAELAEANAHRERLADFQVATIERNQELLTERDLLRETLAESDLGAQVLALEETVAAADADRDRLEVEMAETKAELPKCNGMCLKASDVLDDLSRVVGDPVARAHRSCPLHGDLETVASELDAALTQAEVERDDATAAIARIRRAVVDVYGEDYDGEDVAAEVERLFGHLSEHGANVRRIVTAKSEALERAHAERDALKAKLEESEVDRDEALSVATFASEKAQTVRRERDALKATIERARERLDWLIANGFGARTDTLVDLRAALDAPETSETGTTHVDRHGRSWDRHPFVQGRFTGNGVCMCDQAPEHWIHAPEAPGDAETEDRS